MPERGKEMPVHAEIDLVFDRPLDRASVANAS